MLMIFSFYRNDCFCSPALYGLNENADQVPLTEMRLIHFKPRSRRTSQPWSRFRSLWILEVPFGKQIHNIDSGFNAFTALGASASNSALLRTKIWIQSNFPLRVGDIAASCLSSSMSFSGALMTEALSPDLSFIFLASGDSDM